MSDAHVRITVAGIELEFHGSEALFDRSVASLLPSLTQSSQPTARAAETVETRVTTPVDEGPRYLPPTDRFSLFQRQRGEPEETEETRVAPQADRIASYAFFLWNYEKKEVFHETEVDGCFHADGAEIPTDLGAAYGDLLSRRVLSPGDGDRTWRLTGKGRDYVRHHLMSA